VARVTSFHGSQVVPIHVGQPAVAAKGVPVR
jgi:hypothetical protein